MKRTITEIKNNIFTRLIFLTPEVHKIINSLSLVCLTINNINASVKEKGINFGAIPKTFKSEYLK